ncbi:pfkB family carbohydrate kinase [Methanobrevibacter woesei]|uniref:PfkB family carbohydrate kinase n=1 Tax=Methanobrevibacter woesei TaxID=190976 RepID=A0A2U1S986_9EURY|nr:PfkB family carbohydrate kinase [Methanobrevibacter woesei]PWB87001.1 pfkB family carbohydrate kinase [Methanobrevibacter woesei]
MTLVVLGPATEDIIIKNGMKESKVGGATFFQAFVYEALNIDYLAIVNLSNLDIIDKFPDKNKVIALLKEDTHFFINEYPNEDNLDLRVQLSNFANIPIFVDELKPILDKIDKIDAFVINPLNQYDFPRETMDYLKNFKVPIYLSIQGFLRKKDSLENDDGYNGILLDKNSNIQAIVNDTSGIFLDENEFDIMFEDNDFSSCNVGEIIVTNGSKGSRIISNINDNEIIIEPVEQKYIVDSTGCGDTYMAAYISKKLEAKSSLEAGNFASLIASEKLSSDGPYKKL